MDKYIMNSILLNIIKIKKYWTFFQWSSNEISINTVQTLIGRTTGYDTVFNNLVLITFVIDKLTKVLENKML